MWKVSYVISWRSTIDDLFEFIYIEHFCLSSVKLIKVKFSQLNRTKNIISDQFLTKNEKSVNLTRRFSIWKVCDDHEELFLSPSRGAQKYILNISVNFDTKKNIQQDSSVCESVKIEWEIYEWHLATSCLSIFESNANWWALRTPSRVIVWSFIISEFLLWNRARIDKKSEMRIWQIPTDMNENIFTSTSTHWLEWSMRKYF